MYASRELPRKVDKMVSNLVLKNRMGASYYVIAASNSNTEGSTQEAPIIFYYLRQNWELTPKKQLF